METKICQNKAEWDKGLENSSFLQSWEWGEFQKQTGKKVLRLMGDDWQAQGFEHRLPGLGKYLYAPRFQISDFRFQNLIEFLKKEDYVFLRLEPVEKINLQSAICNLQLIKNRQPSQTLILNLTKSEEQLLSAMHAKTRYNIGLAERKGIIIKQEKNVGIFWELNKKTIERNEIRSHEKKYYEKMIELNICYQLTAYFENKPIASNIMIIFNNTATYLHGASDEQYKNLMAPYLLQWEGIKLAKTQNCQYYDFWGVALLSKTACPAEANGVILVRGPRFKNLVDFQSFHGYFWDKNHSWSGVTRFKVGFGGEYKEYPQAVDIVLKKWQYKVYKLARKIRRLKD